ncbi:hypothetical protein ACOSQ3_031185 [Xanthoceras sorbifolium]
MNIDPRPNSTPFKNTNIVGVSCQFTHRPKFNTTQAQIKIFLVRMSNSTPSAFAAAAVLFSTLQIHPEKFSHFKRVNLDTCQILNEVRWFLLRRKFVLNRLIMFSNIVNLEGLLSCLEVMSLTSTALMLTSLHPPKDNLEQYEKVASAIDIALEKVEVAI